VVESFPFFPSRMCDAMIWSGLSRFDPLVDCPDRIKGVRAIAPTARVHSGSHEEPVRVPYVGRASHKIQDAVVIVDAAKRRYRGVSPSVVLQQLSSTAKEILRSPKMTTTGGSDSLR
jgi:hypothetical protein